MTFFYNAIDILVPKSKKIKSLTFDRYTSKNQFILSIPDKKIILGLEGKLFQLFRIKSNLNEVHFIVRSLNFKPRSKFPKLKLLFLVSMKFETAKKALCQQGCPLVSYTTTYTFKEL